MFLKNSVLAPLIF